MIEYTLGAAVVGTTLYCLGKDEHHDTTKEAALYILACVGLTIIWPVTLGVWIYAILDNI